QSGLPPLRHRVDQHFGVAPGDEATAECLQFTPQFAIVVDLPIEGSYITPSRVAHRLGAIRPYIDNREAAVPERNVTLGWFPESGAVRSASLLKINQTADDLGLNRTRLRIDGQDSSNATHAK